MPRVATMEIVRGAMAGGYAVPAINIVNDLTLEAVLAAAEEARAPMIVQTSVKTVRAIGVEVLWSMWHTMSARVSVPVALHLDHCPDRSVISACLAAGWNSVLFDAHELSVEENERQCLEVVAEARRYGADVEGEIEGIRGVEDGIGSDEQSPLQTLAVAVDFIERTGVDIFAPAIGNAHGMYAAAPVLDHQRISDLVEATGHPHGAPWWHRTHPRAVQRPHRPWLRQGQRLDGIEDRLHGGQPTLSRRAPGRRRPAEALRPCA